MFGRNSSKYGSVWKAAVHASSQLIIVAWRKKNLNLNTAVPIT
jgi:hypothetical protein